MKIKSIDVENGFQHESLKADFTDFNVIIGPNGCGKSSIVELIGYTLTNKFTWPGTLDTIVRQGAEKGKVTLMVEDEGEEIEITTALGRTSRKLVRGDEKISKSSEVLEYIENVLLRTPIDLVNEASIVRQGALDAGLFTTQAKRHQVFQRLAGLSNIEIKRKKLADAKALCTPFMISFNLDEKKRQVSNLRERISQIDTELTELKKQDFSQERYDQCKVLMTNLENMRKYSAEQKSLKQEHEQLLPIVQESEQQLNNTKASLDASQTQLEQKKPAYDEALRMVTLAETQKKQQAERARLVEKLEATKKGLADLQPVPEDFEDEPKIAEFQGILSEANNQVAQAKKVVSSLSATDKKCPTCATELADPSAIIEKNKAVIAEMSEIAAVASEQVTTTESKKRQWAQSLQLYRTKLAELQATKSNVEDSLASLSDVKEEPISDEQHQLVINEYSELSKAVTSLRKQYESIREILDEAKTKLQACEVRMDAVSENLAGLGNPDGGGVSTTEARVYVDDFEHHRSRTSELNGQRSEVVSQMSTAEEDLLEAEQKAEEAKKYEVFADHLEFARNALHRDNFPAGKIKSFIDKVLLNSEAYLEVMEAGFTITYDHDNGFIAYFPEQDKTMRADRLSGGERVTFALAFRLAVNEVKCETGFLYLDEPTAHLDDNHVDNVVRVLELVKKNLAGKVQLFIVTHDEKIAAVADTLLEVKKASK